MNLKACMKLMVCSKCQLVAWIWLNSDVVYYSYGGSRSFLHKGVLCLVMSFEIFDMWHTVHI